MSYVATQLLEAGGDIITDNLMAVFCTQAEDQAKVWAHSVSIPTPLASTFLPNALPPAQPHVTQEEPVHVPQLPAVRQKPSLKVSKLFPVFSTPSHRTNTIEVDLEDNEDDPGIYNKTIDGVGDGMHLITASFIKTKDKIRDQLLMNFTYFSELMYTSNNGLKIHPVSTDNLSLF
jgi:hypothetical protein